MNLDNIRAFQEVVRLGSFSEVAKTMGISQPAVSFQIQKLEQELGLRLLDRSQRALTLTSAGKRLLQFAEAVGQEREQLRRDLEHLRDDVSGELLIASSTIPGECLLPTWLAGFKAANPAVTVKMSVSDSLTVIESVSNNEYEVGFCGVEPPGQELESMAVAEDEIVLIVFPEHPFARRGEIMPADLEGEPLIFREDTSGTQRNLMSRLAKSGPDSRKLSPQMVLGTTQAVLTAVEAGAGIAFISNLAVRKSLACNLVRTVKVNGLNLRRNFYCVYRRERIVSKLLETFIAFIKAGPARRIA